MGNIPTSPKAEDLTEAAPSFADIFRIVLYILYIVIYYDSMAKNKTKHEISGIEGVIETLCRINDPQKMKGLLREILTPTEYHDLAMRWELMRRLQEGYTQRKIASDLKISLCKITRGSKILKKPGAVAKQYLKKRRQT